jgi:hypothetical protein
MTALCIALAFIAFAITFCLGWIFGIAWTVGELNRKKS